MSKPLSEFITEGLQTYTTPHAEEREMLTRMWDLVTQSPQQCFSRRHYLPGHFTASAWVLNADHSCVLLLHHTKLKKWLQPGGHIEDDLSIADAALREVIEETGLEHIEISPKIFDIDIHLIPARKHEPNHYHYDIRYLITAAFEHEIKISHESNEMVWIPLHEVANYNAEQSIMRMVAKSVKLAKKKR